MKFCDMDEKITVIHGLITKNGETAYTYSVEDPVAEPDMEAVIERMGRSFRQDPEVTDVDWVYMDLPLPDTMVKRIQDMDANKEPCSFCSKFDFSTVRALVEDDKWASIAQAGGLSRFPKEKQFRFCPVCGRRRFSLDEEGRATE